MSATNLAQSNSAASQHALPAPTVSHTPSAPPLRADATCMALIGLAHSSSHFGHLLLAPLFPVFKTEFDLSYTQLGALATLFFVISGVGQAMAGFLVDKVGPRRVMYAALCCFAAAAAVAGTAQGYGGLVLATALAGLGNAPFHPIDFSVLNARISPQRLGYAYSVHGLTGSLGWALAPLVLVGGAALWGWRGAYVAAFALYACVFLMLRLNESHWRIDRAEKTPAAGSAAASTTSATSATSTPSSTASAAPTPSALSVLAFLKLPAVWGCFAFFFTTMLTLGLFQNYLPPLLAGLSSVSLGAGAATLSAYMVANALGMLSGGVLISRGAASGAVSTNAPNWTQKPDAVVAATITTGAALLLLCALLPLPAWLLVTLVIVTGFTIGIGNPSRDMMIKKATPKGATGRVYGVVYSGLDAGFAVSPLIFGRLLDGAAAQPVLYQWALALAAAFLLLAVGMALAVGKWSGVQPVRA